MAKTKKKRVKIGKYEAAATIQSALQLLVEGLSFCERQESMGSPISPLEWPLKVRERPMGTGHFGLWEMKEQLKRRRME